MDNIRPDLHYQRDLSLLTKRFETTKCVNSCDRKIPEWVETFNQILKHATSGDFMVQFSKLSTNTERIKLCLRTSSIRDMIAQYIERCFNVLKNTCGCFAGQKKMAKKAKDFLLVGNLELSQNRNLEAWVAYSRALVYAPRDCEEAPLAYGNRSAVYFRWKQFENAIEDIECALALNYDKYKPISKLQRRKAKCLRRLNQVIKEQGLSIIEAKPAEGQNAICKQTGKNASKVRENANRFKDLKHIIKEYCSQNLFTPQEKLSSLSTKVEIRYDPFKGRYLVAKKSISADETLTISQPYVTVMTQQAEIKLDRCHHCMAACFPQTYWTNFTQWANYPRMSNPVPCFNCSNVIFCCEACRSKSCDTYHKFECGQLPILYKLIMPPYDLHLVLRMMYATGSLSKNRDIANAFKEWENFLDLNDPVGYSEVYGLAFNEKSTGMEDLLKQCISACLLTKLAELSGFAQNPSDHDFVGSTFLRHLLQYKANVCSFTKHLPSPFDENATISYSNPSSFTFSLIDPIVSLLNHSCTANLTFEAVIPFDYFYLQSNIMECKAQREIKEGEELTINYIPMIIEKQPVEVRQKIIWDVFAFHCACDNCEMIN